MNNYIEELREVVQGKLSEYVSNLEKIKFREIQKFEWLEVTQIGGIPEKTSKLFSGKEILITPRGSIRIMEKLKNGAKGVTIEFWSLDMKISFDGNNEKFTVIELGNFKAFD